VHAPGLRRLGTNGGWSNGGYYVHNNMWNCRKYSCSETLYACSYHSWYVVANMNNNSGDGAVKTYPNVHKDYQNVPIRSFKSITSTFATTSPHVGIYNVAYDIWTNGIATSGSTEFMIWTENFHQTPAGSRVTTATFGGRNYNVWKTANIDRLAGDVGRGSAPLQTILPAPQTGGRRAWVILPAAAPGPAERRTYIRCSDSHTGREGTAPTASASASCCPCRTSSENWRRCALQSAGATITMA
jgi:hypothetical protein